MAHNERDEVPILSETQQQLSDDYNSSQPRSRISRTRSVSISIPTSSMESYESIPSRVGYTGPLRSERRTPFSLMRGPLHNHGPESTFRHNRGAPGTGSTGVESQHMKEKFPSFSIKDRIDSADDDYGAKNEHLLRSGRLGMCNDRYCTTCPSHYNRRAQQTSSESSSIADTRFHKALYGDAKKLGKEVLHLCQCPHSWRDKSSCSSCPAVEQIFCHFLRDGPLCRPIVFVLAVCTKGPWQQYSFFRSMTDLMYLLHILLQFRLAYVAPETRVAGAGDLVDHPKRIFLHYLRGYFLLDLLVAVPLPQVLISSAKYAMIFLRAGVLVQYILRLYRVLPLLVGQSPTGLIFESAWANFVINLLMFVLAGHVVGSCWYFLGLQRVDQCLRKACKPNLCDFVHYECRQKIKEFKKNETLWKSCKTTATACFTTNGERKYGIHQNAVKLTQNGMGRRYLYSLFWAFQQISTLAGNQTPSDFVPEVLFLMGIIGLGLLLFGLLIGNMQNFLQSLGRRRLEMSLRQRDVEQWMSHRRLPQQLRRRVREAELYHWAATRGVNEEMLLENFPEDLQKDIRRHLFKFVKRVRIFAVMEDHIIDAICERLRQKIYIKGSKILHPGARVEKMIFIVRGKIESRGEDGVTSLCEGDFCGEELLAWCLESSSVNKDGRKIRPPGNWLLSNRTVTCVTNVEAFALRAEDLEEVTRIFARFLRKPRVQGAIRYVSPYWRGLAATRIQVAWRYKKKRLSRSDTSRHSILHISKVC